MPSPRTASSSSAESVNSGEVTSVKTYDPHNSSDSNGESEETSSSIVNQNIQNPNFKNGNIVNISYMFNYCKKLESINLSYFNTENVTNMSGMFQHCENLKKIDLSFFRTKNVSQLGCMFNNCYNLETIVLPKNFCSNNLEFMAWMFYGCEKIQLIDLSSLNILEKIDITNMFEGCDLLKNIKVKNDYIQYFKSNFKNLADKFI